MALASPGKALLGRPAPARLLEQQRYGRFIRAVTRLEAGAREAELPAPGGEEPGDREELREAPRAAEAAKEGLGLSV